MNKHVLFSETIEYQEYDTTLSPKECLSPQMIYYVNFNKGDFNEIITLNRVENWFDGIDISVSVKNIVFEKKVFARATKDNWKTYEDYVGKHIFTRIVDYFNINIPVVEPDSTVEFAICYQVDGKEYWLNNNNKNFIVSKK